MYNDSRVSISLKSIWFQKKTCNYMGLWFLHIVIQVVCFREYDPERTMGDWRSGPRAVPEPTRGRDRERERDRDRERECKYRNKTANNTV